MLCVSWGASVTCMAVRMEAEQPRVRSPNGVHAGSGALPQATRGRRVAPIGAGTTPVALFKAHVVRQDVNPHDDNPKKRKWRRVMLAFIATQLFRTAVSCQDACGTGPDLGQPFDIAKSEVVGW